MKQAILLLTLCAAVPAYSAIIYFDLADVVVPYDDEGVYINIVTGETVNVFPSDFDDAPWLNLYYGGSRIFTSDLLRPWASRAPGEYDDTLTGHYFINLSPGTPVDGSGVFVDVGSVSQHHIGFDAAQFQSGVQGYLAFEYQATSGASAAYGWLSFTPNASGEGFSVDFARSDTPGESLTVGASVIPEPSAYAMLAGGLVLGLTVLRRRKI